MPLLLWLARFVSSSLALLVNLAASGALFLLSAFLFTQSDEDARNVAWFVRGGAAIWLWVAIWTFVLHGVIQLAKKPHDPKRKPSGAEMARSTLGCLGGIAAVALLFVYVGDQADWIMGGLQGGDPAHPAHLWAERARLGIEAAANEPAPERYFPWFVGVVGGVIALRVFLAAVDPRRRKEPAGRQASRERASGGRSRGGTATSQASTRTTSAPASQTLDDPTLGLLRWESGRGMWRVPPPAGVGALYIDTSGQAPSKVQVDLARAIAQRSFEVLLRGSDAARPAAQARGVGLPRFTIAEAVVHADQGRATAATLQLRCDGDGSGTYAVRSTDVLNTFQLT
jgi:hypothetical protein